MRSLVDKISFARGGAEIRLQKRIRSAAPDVERSTTT
jgi:hypothetical protein